MASASSTALRCRYCVRRWLLWCRRYAYSARFSTVRPATNATANQAANRRRRRLSGIGGPAGAEHVSHAAQREDERTAAARIYLAADAADQDVDGIGHGIEVVVPDVRENTATIEYPIRVPHEILEEGVLAGGEPDLPAFAARQSRGGIELEIFEVEYDAQRFGRPTRQGAEPGEELLHGEWLGEIIVRAGVEAMHAVGQRIPRRQHQNRGSAALSPPAAAYFESLEIRQPQVENDQVILIDGQRFEGFAAGRHRIRRPSGFTERSEEKARQFRLVFDD